MKISEFFRKSAQKVIFEGAEKKLKVIPSTRNPHRGNGRVENGIGGVNKDEQNY